MMAYGRHIQQYIRMAYGRSDPAIQLVATGGIMASVSTVLSTDSKGLERFWRVAYF